MINTDLYIEKLIQKISETQICYYEEAPTGIAHPYLTLSNFNISDLASGDLAMFDIEIWFTEFTDSNIDQLCDQLRNELNRTTLNEEGAFSSTIYFENQNMVKDREQDLIVRRLSFSTRIFYK